ncbi:hypothetical protein L6452_22815 [Arctium lappa]|uniref:Uncharacterized protein n=1 Tax=Arctium lappa TaxID=4217 RepID=A0ACB9B168_ARCLA|nr:hypothetical protein L6452_22815 [Arctium lappa]
MGDSFWTERKTKRDSSEDYSVYISIAETIIGWPKNLQNVCSNLHSSSHWMHLHGFEPKYIKAFPGIELSSLEQENSFKCDASQVLNEMEECKKAYLNAYIRCLAFDNVKQAQYPPSMSVSDSPKKYSVDPTTSEICFSGAVPQVHFIKSRILLGCQCQSSEW